jgi:phosphoribosylformimino-5-aminoimidazole carboxamide ribotide isomerase
LSTKNNLQIIKNLVHRVPAKIQVGGGIHTFERAKTLLNANIFRIIFGTRFVTNPELVEEVSQCFGANRVAVALDVKKGKVMVNGWKTSSGIDYLDLAHAAETLKVGAIICTAVEMDGTLQGPAIDYITHLVDTVSVPVIASGGVSTIDDLKTLAQTGVDGTIVGAALYEKRFSLKEALEDLKNVS